MPPVKQPTEAESKDQTAQTNGGPAEVTAEQMVAFLLNQARELKTEKDSVYKRIQSNREILRAQVPIATDDQQKEINSLYPVKKGGGRRKKSETTTAS